MNPRAQEAGASVWKRLEANAAANQEVFRDARIVLEKIAAIPCRGCGTVEKALFWTAVRRSDERLLLRCPFCDAHEVWFDVKANRVPPPLGVRVALAVAAGLATISAAGALAVFVLAGAENRHSIGAMVDGTADRLAARSVGAGSDALASAARDQISFGLDAAADAPPARELPRDLGGGGVPRPSSAGAPARMTATVAFLAEGDRREEIAALLAPLGEVARAAVRVEYRPESDQTLLVVDSLAAAALLRAVEAASGWQRTE
jgi:hypothetical protein